MRILIATPMFPPDQAGIALQTSMLAKGLRAAGHEAKVIAFSPRDASDAAADEHVTFVDRRLRQRAFSPSLWWTLRRLAGWADVVNVHGYTRLNLHAWLARRGRPLFVTYHGTDVWSYDPSQGLGIFGRLNRRARIVCVSQPLADALQEKTGVPSAVVEPAIADGYIGAAQRTGPPAKADPPAALYVKSFYPVNCHDAAIRAMQRVCERLPGAQLWLAGDGPLRGELESLAADLGIRDNVKFLGLLDNEQLVEKYSQASAFVNTASLESYGNVTVEALACGAPAVACETAGGKSLAAQFPDDIQLVPQGDIGALADAIRDRLAEPRPVTPRALAAIAADKSTAAMTAKYLALFEQSASPE